MLIKKLLRAKFFFFFHYLKALCWRYFGSEEGPHFDTHVSVKTLLTQHESFSLLKAEGRYKLRKKSTIHWPISTNLMISIFGP